MKYFRKILLLILIIPCMCVFSACSLFDKPVYVVGIEKSESFGNTQIYKVSYSDGSTSSFEVKNGEDADDLNITDLFNLGVSMGVYTNDQAGFEAFIKSLNIKSDPPASSIEQATNKALQSVVRIYAHHYVDRYSFYGETSKSTITNTGSGVIYKMDDDYSYVITNYHVLYDKQSNTTNKVAPTIYAYQYGTEGDAYEIVNQNNIVVKDENGYPKTEFTGDAVKCEFIGGEPVFDLAIIRMSTKTLLDINPNTRAVDITPNGYSITDTALAIGNPEGYGISVTQGIISVDSEEITMKSLNGYSNVILHELRIDTAINGGNSGGGLFNANGELIGIVNAKLTSDSSGSTIENMGYALPYQDAIAVADNIISNYKITRKKQGVRILNLGLTYAVGHTHTLYDTTTGKLQIVDNLIVDSTTGIAHYLGLDTGDVITAVNIKTSNDTTPKTYDINRAYQIRNILLTLKVGDQFTITYARENLSQSTIAYTVKSTDISDLNSNNFTNNSNYANYLYQI